MGRANGASATRSFLHGIARQRGKFPSALSLSMIFVQAPAPTSDPRSTSAEQALRSSTGRRPRGNGDPMADMVTPLRKTARRRNKVHLAFVAAQPCLVCQRSPCEAKHLKFAQPRALGARSAMSSPCRCAGIIIGRCIAMATKSHGGPTFRSRPWTRNSEGTLADELRARISRNA